MTISVIRSTCIINCFNPIFCSKLSWLIDLKNLLFFHISLLYVNLSSWIIFCLFWGDIFFFRYFFIILICNCFYVFWIFFSFSSNFITNQITSCFCCFLNSSFKAVLKASAADCLARSEFFDCIYHWSFYVYFYQYFYPCFFIF